MKSYVNILLVFVIFLFSIAFFIIKQYGFTICSLVLLIIALKLETLLEIGASIKNGLYAKFEIPREKIISDIKDNHEKVTDSSYKNFFSIEEKILIEQQRIYRGKLKRQIHFIYDAPSAMKFEYVPDGSLISPQDNKLYFFEIKYLQKPELASKIIKDTLVVLKRVIDTFASSAENKLVIKLIIASKFPVDLNEFMVKPGIVIEHYEL